VLATEDRAVSDEIGHNIDNAFDPEINFERFLLSIDRRFIPNHVVGQRLVAAPKRNDRRKEKVGAGPLGLRAPDQKGVQQRQWLNGQSHFSLPEKRSSSLLFHRV
jgi:hypothetical protein